MAGAGGAVIGALRAVLGIDTVDFEKGLKDAQSGLASFAKQATTIAAGIGLERAIEGAVTAFGNLVKKSIEVGDQMGKASQKIGVPVEELSKLKFAAELSDLSFEQLIKGLGKLSKSMVEAAAKPSGEAAEAFQDLGIKVRDASGKIKPTSGLLSEIADKFAGAKDGAAKTAIAIALFGRAGADLIPLLNQGADGLERAKKEAEQLGLVLSKETTDAAENFNDDLKRLHSVVDAFGQKVAAGILPQLQKFTAQLVDLAKNSTIVEDFVSAVIKAFGFIVEQLQIVSLAIRRFGVEWTAFRKFLQTPIFTDEWFENWNKFNEAGEESARQMGDLIASFKNGRTSALAVAAGIDDITDKEKKNEQAKRDLITRNREAAKAFDDFIKQQEKGLATQQAEFDATKQATGAKERLKIELQALALEQDKGAKMSETQRAKLVEVAAAAELLGLKIGNVRLIGEANPFLPLQTNLDATLLKLQGLQQGTKDYMTLSEQAALLQEKIWTTAATSVGQAFESMGSSLASMSNNWARLAAIGKAIGATVAFINSYIAASNALATAIFPANIAIAAGVLAQGLAMVAAIKTAIVPKMATGGSFRVPGGVGGGDKVFTPLLLEPGERVDVHSNASQEARRQATTINVQGKIFDRDTIIEIIDGLNSAFGDNHTLKFAPA